MCGIAGLATHDPSQMVEESLLASMARSLRHRGPDDQSVFTSRGGGLAMSRLAVIDIDKGQQPVRNEDESVIAVFNGEIYNFQELATELNASGHHVRSNCDSEVIVHLYETDGIDFVKKLRGMFAIALWDQKRRRLLLARDRLGVKPLYFHLQADRLTFASEIKALLQDPSVPRVPDLGAIDHMIRFGHFAPGQTAYSGIAEVPAATTLCYERGSVTHQTYWDYQSHIESVLPKRTEYDRNRSVDDLHAHLNDAVSERLTSEVPLGAFLSGGIDSSVVVTLMSQLLDEPFDAFSIGFDDGGFDERPFAREVAQRCGVRLHEFVVKPDIQDLLPTLIRHHDSPFYDTSAIPTYYLCELARKKITVALSGDGGDELFAGYNIFAANKFASSFRRLPSFLRNGLIKRIADCVPESSSYLNRGRVLREFLRAVDLEPIERYARWNTKVKWEDREQLYRHEELRSRLRRSDALLLADEHRDFVDATELDRQLYIAMKRELACDMLVKVDRMSMAHGLEVRSPLLSHSLFEFAATLPDSAKIRRYQGKNLLRQLAERLLPKKIVRRPKRGFSIPIDRWLRGPLGEHSREILLDDQTARRGLFRTDVVETFFKEHADGTKSRGREIWTMLTVELWHRMYIDEPPSVTSPITPIAITSANIAT